MTECEKPAQIVFRNTNYNFEVAFVHAVSQQGKQIHMLVISHNSVVTQGLSME